MLDLNNLERKLDKALANETSDSLNKWLHRKRTQSFLIQYGLGRFQNLSSYSNTFKATQNNSIFNVNASGNDCEPHSAKNYQVAA